MSGAETAPARGRPPRRNRRRRAAWEEPRSQEAGWASRDDESPTPVPVASSSCPRTRSSRFHGRGGMQRACQRAVRSTGQRVARRAGPARPGSGRPSGSPTDPGPCEARSPRPRDRPPGPESPPRPRLGTSGAARNPRRVGMFPDPRPILTTPPHARRRIGTRVATGVPPTAPARMPADDAVELETTGSAATSGADPSAPDWHPGRQDVTEKIDPTARETDTGLGGGRDAVPEVGPRLPPQSAEARAPHPGPGSAAVRARDGIEDVLGAALRHSRRWRRVRRARGRR